MATSYDDGKIICDDHALSIRGYYFPWGTKKIRYEAIKGLTRISMGAMSGQWRIWGTGTFRTWANFDAGRPRKTSGLLVDLGGRIKPLITPDDTDEVEAILRRSIPLELTDDPPVS